MHVQLVQKLYQEVIDDLVKNMKQEFENEGVDDQILQELQNVRRDCCVRDLMHDRDCLFCPAVPKIETPTEHAIVYFAQTDLVCALKDGDE